MAFSHITLGSNDLARAGRFYDAALAPLGFTRHYDSAEALGYGTEADRGRTSPVWIVTPFDGGPATFGNGTHIAFEAESRAQVEAFHRAALAAGGKDEGAPGLRPHYHPAYYGAYVRDLDGNKLQAVCHRPD